MAKIKGANLNSFYGAGNANKPDVGNSLKSLPSSKPKHRPESHTADTKYGMGNYYGTGYKAPVGKVRDTSVGFRPVSREQLGKPPKSLA